LRRTYDFCHFFLGGGTIDYFKERLSGLAMLACPGEETSGGQEPGTGLTVCGIGLVTLRRGRPLEAGATVQKRKWHQNPPFHTLSASEDGGSVLLLVMHPNSAIEVTIRCGRST